MDRTTKSLFALSIGAAVMQLASAAQATTLTVGAGMMYPTPSAAAAAAQDGDVIEISPGTYRDYATWRANNLTIRGVGGTRAHLDATGLTISNGKGIMVIQGMNTTVENIEFTGASVPDANGAGIRQEGPGLTVRNCLFRDNEDGILAGDNATSDIVIESSEFDHNGAGDGQSHNMYINHVRSFTLRGCYSHDADTGHLVKSRAFMTSLLYNRILGRAGTDSYEIDLPNGGLVYVIGNVIQQGANTGNSNVVMFAAEGASNPMQALYFVGNTVVNDRSAGTFIFLHGTPMARIVDNIFAGAGAVVSGAPAMEMSNLNSNTPGFVDRTGYDYHLVAGSAAIDMGTDPGSVNGMQLAPTMQYTDLATESRMTVGSAIDIGAFEFGNVAMPGMDASVTTDASVPTDVPVASDIVSPPTDARGDVTASDASTPADASVNPTHPGCGCAVPRRDSTPRGLALAVGALALVLARRRKN